MSAPTKRQPKGQSTGGQFAPSTNPESTLELSDADVVIEEYSGGRREWRLPNLRLHRTDGPAVEFVDGYTAHFVDGKFIEEDEFNARYLSEGPSADEQARDLGYESHADLWAQSGGKWEW